MSKRERSESHSPGGALRKAEKRAPRTIGVLSSGGLDSAVLLHRFLKEKKRVLPLYLECGFVWEAAERYWLERLLRALRSPGLLPLRRVEAPLRLAYGAHWGFSGHGVPDWRSADAAVYLPGRNALLLTHAAIVCAREGLSTLALGVLKGNPFGDATPLFFSQLAGCLTRALNSPIRIHAPLRRWTKVQLISQAAEEKTPLGLTFSCLRPLGRVHCGVCNKCAERQRAFRQAGVADPTTYRNS